MVPTLRRIVGRGRRKVRAPDGSGRDRRCLHRPPLPGVRAAHPGRGQPVPTGPCGPGAVGDPCRDPPPLGWVTCSALASRYGKQRLGAGVPRSLPSDLGVWVGRSDSACQTGPGVAWGWRSPRLDLASPALGWTWLDPRPHTCLDRKTHADTWI